jgi:hypothetical protein
MDRLTVARVLLLGLLLFGGGCYHYVRASDTDRAASFAALRDARVDQQPLERHLRRRTAVVVWGTTALAARTRGPTLILDVESPRDGRIGYGHAAAIERDGYFLTAAHCTEDAKFYLVFLRDDGPAAATARVVARVEDDASGIDIAVVHVDAHVPDVFDWSEERALRRHTPAASVGFTEPVYITGRTKYFPSTCLGGQVRGTRRCSCAAFTATAVFSDVPLRPGDSGGPLVRAGDGTLIAINTRGLLSWTGSDLMVAGSIRPDAAWVRRVIDIDRRRAHDIAPALPTSRPVTTRPARRGRSLVFSLDADDVMDQAVGGLRSKGSGAALRSATGVGAAARRPPAFAFPSSRQTSSPP